MDAKKDSYPFDLVAGQLLAKLEAEPDLNLVVLPSCPRVDGLYYSEFDATVLKAARAEGLEGIDYLHNHDERRHVHEYSAGWILDIALGVPTNLIADGILLLVGYTFAQIKNARNRGLIDPGEPPQVRITAASIKRSDDGTVKIKDLVVEGTPKEALSSLVALVAPDYLEIAKSEVDRLESTGDED